MPSDPRTDVRLRLGTRGSPLALAQAQEASARLCSAHGWPPEAVELVPVVATGDRVQDRPLTEIGGKEVWTRELDRELAAGRIDAAVHSMKDVETERPAELRIAAILPRADRSDRLVGAPSIADIPEGAVVGTSAPRRAAQIRRVRPDLAVVPIRGNIATRLAKLDRGEVAATFLASAGLIRLGMEHVGHVLPMASWLPAPAQGAIGVECRRSDESTLALLAAIDDACSARQIALERAFLKGLGGSCRSPVAMRCDVEGETARITAALYSEDGAEAAECDVAIPGCDPGAARRIAAELVEGAPAAVAVLFRPDPG
jgi:hydroxymethylbilane synthase